MILATTRIGAGLGAAPAKAGPFGAAGGLLLDACRLELPGLVASAKAFAAALAAPTETRLGGGELLRRARRKTLPLVAPSLAARCGLETLSDDADEATASGAELLRRARRKTLPLALPSLVPSESLGLHALAAGLGLTLGAAAALRRARREAARDVSSASPGIGMPLARVGPLAGVGVWLRGDGRVAGAALSGTALGSEALDSLAGPSALVVLGRGAPRRDDAVWRSSIGRASSRRLARGDKSASASESQSDGSGLPNSRLPDRRCVPVAKAPSSGSGHSSILFMPGVLSTGGGSSHSEGGTRGPRL